MTFRSDVLRDAAEARSCVRCGCNDDTVVGAHYTGMRRLAYGGGYGIKVHDFLVAHLCGRCHLEMDQLSRDKHNSAVHSEEFLHLIALTLIRLFDDGLIGVQ